ncbi:hypothetical protein QYH69_01485 [Paraburkholderia sp. SARCC-3016]|uniref:hypothetical protein n=1 Tax=Paraburkholderia sp. SARCC-3016 TaxID=3058611 RepID=UPI0028094C06|nr:hypothetical protein [Paraburkholderia sp. SARCC-3016]MDQ7975919.1 hypothetical protein [Paraburkholderia sp. SARCC-3016]
MTLPATLPLSMSQIANELGRALPLGMLDPMVLSLAGKSAPPISFTDLLGKTGRYDGSVKTGAISLQRSIDWLNGTARFFDVFLSEVVWNSPTTATLFTWSPSNEWRGNILVRNNTTGVQGVFVPAQPALYSASGFDANNLIRNGATDNYTIVPSF